MVPFYVTYRGFKYSQLAGGKWSLTMPSGLRSVIDAATEDQVKTIIDSIVSTAATGN